MGGADLGAMPGFNAEGPMSEAGSTGKGEAHQVIDMPEDAERDGSDSESGDDGVQFAQRQRDAAQV